MLRAIGVAVARRADRPDDSAGHPRLDSRSTCRRPKPSTAICAGCAAIAGEERRGPVVHRHGVLRLRDAQRHPAQRVREPVLVHALHAVPGGDRAGAARIAAELPDRREGPDGHGHRDGVAARRRHRGGRGDDDVPPGADEEGAAGAGERVPRLGPMLPADAGRAARPRRTARHPAGDRRPGVVQRRAAGARVRPACCSTRTIAAP